MAPGVEEHQSFSNFTSSEEGRTDLISIMSTLYAHSLGSLSELGLASQQVALSKASIEEMATELDTITRQLLAIEARKPYAILPLEFEKKENQCIDDLIVLLRKYCAIQQVVFDVTSSMGFIQMELFKQRGGTEKQLWLKMLTAIQQLDFAQGRFERVLTRCLGTILATVSDKDTSNKILSIYQTLLAEIHQRTVMIPPPKQVSPVSEAA